MTIEIGNTNIVLLTEDLSPSQFNHDFLREIEVVDGDWKPIVNENVVTPVMSIIKYLNEYEFLFQGNKIQLNFNKGNQNIGETQVADIAIKFVEQFRLQRYTAVGVNAILFTPHDNADKFIMDTFLQSGKWNNDNFEQASIALVYRLDDFTLRIRIEPGVRKDNQPGIIYNANFNLNLDKALSVKKRSDIIIDVLSKISNLYDYLFKVIEQIGDGE